MKILLKQDRMDKLWTAWDEKYTATPIFHPKT